MFNKPIRSDDENAIDLLKEKANKLQENQDDMKAANKYFRENNTMQGYKEISDEKAEKWDKAIWDSYSKIPYAPWQLQNNYQNLSTTKKRIRSLERENAYESDTSKYDTEKLGFSVKEDKNDMRLRLYFDEKPKERIRDMLKSSGFKWSPKNECWQRLLNLNARYSLDRFIIYMERQQNNTMEM